LAVVGPRSPPRSRAIAGRVPWWPNPGVFFPFPNPPRKTLCPAAKVHDPQPGRPTKKPDPPPDFFPKFPQKTPPPRKANPPAPPPPGFGNPTENKTPPARPSPHWGPPSPPPRHPGKTDTHPLSAKKRLGETAGRPPRFSGGRTAPPPPEKNPAVQTDPPTGITPLGPRPRWGPAGPVLVEKRRAIPAPLQKKGLPADRRLVECAGEISLNQTIRGWPLGKALKRVCLPPLAPPGALLPRKRVSGGGPCEPPSYPVFFFFPLPYGCLSFPVHFLGIYLETHPKKTPKINLC